MTGACASKFKVMQDFFSSLIDFLYSEKEWIFSGIGIVALAWAANALRQIFVRLKKKRTKNNIKPKATSDNFSIDRANHIVDILDKAGKRARFRKEEHITALVDGFSKIHDMIACSGSSKIIRSENIHYKEMVSHLGSVNVEKFRTSKPYNAGDKLYYLIERELVDTFTDEQEYWETEILREIDWLRIEVRFPKDRPFHWYKGVVRAGYETHQSDSQPTVENRDGRMILAWEINAPLKDCLYRIDWGW